MMIRRRAFWAVAAAATTILVGTSTSAESTSADTDRTRVQLTLSHPGKGFRGGASEPKSIGRLNA